MNTQPRSALHLQPLVRHRTRDRHGALPLLLGLGLCAALAACSSQDATLVSGDAALQPATGRVALALSAGNIELSSLEYTLRGPSGQVVLEGQLDLTGADAAFVAFDAPAGGGYSLALTGRSPSGIQCAGEALVEVLANSTATVAIELLCESAGEVAVTGTLLPPEACPSVALAPLSSAVAVGARVQLRAAAETDGAVGYAWASSGGSLEGALTPAATFTCTEVGPVTLTLTATLDACSDTASTVIDCAAAGSGACAGLGETCHPVDPGSGPLHDCHELGHAGDDNACSADRAGCVAACGAELCGLLGALCHEVDPGSGPLHDCHELGHAGDAAACFEGGRACYDLCTEARALASQPVTLSFAGKVGDEDFACGQSYASLGSSGVGAAPQDFRFFVSDVRLVDADGREEPVQLDTRAPWQLPEVALLDFEDQSGFCSGGTAATNTTLTGRVFPGEYVGVSFRMAVPEFLNHADPALAAAPLELGSMSWGWLLGYRFLRAEMAGLGDAGTALGGGLLHLGSTACTGNPQAGSVVCANPNRNQVRLSGFDPDTAVIVADIGALFDSSDLSQDSFCHSTGEFCAGPFQSAGIDLDSGAALEAQTLFRIE